MRKVLVVVATVFFCASGLLAQSQQAEPSQREESLGEVARKLREKKAKPAAAKVYTNDDLEKLARGRISVVGQPSAAPAATTAAPEGQPAAAAPAGEAAAGAAAPAAEQQGEQYWRGKFAEARGNIARAEQELDLLQRELNLTRMQFNQDPNQAMRQQYLGEQAGGKVAELRQKIQAKQTEVEQLRTALTNLENELRRSGGSPGWARP